MWLSNESGTQLVNSRNITQLYLAAPGDSFLTTGNHRYGILARVVGESLPIVLREFDEIHRDDAVDLFTLWRHMLEQEDRVAKETGGRRR